MTNQKVDYIIVGQGLAGTLVHYFLIQSGKSAIIINKSNVHAASHVAAGIINPVTGRQFVKSWMFDDLHEKALATYHDLEINMGNTFLHQRPIYRALAEIKDENTWLAKTGTPGYESYMDSDFTKVPNDIFHDELSYGVTKRSCHLDMGRLCTSYKAYIGDDYIEGEFDREKIVFDQDQLVYENIEAKAVIFCEGWRAILNPYFSELPFAPAKGEVLLCRIPEFKIDAMVKHILFFIPKGDDLYWVGSNYSHGTENEHSTANGKEALLKKINQVLQLPYEVIEHMSGIRPATKSRRPIMGHHPDQKSILLFNGLGTKGASLGPYWASTFVGNMLNDNLLDINEFVYMIRRM